MKETKKIIKYGLTGKKTCDDFDINNVKYAEIRITQFGMEISSLQCEITEYGKRKQCYCIPKNK